MEKYVAYTHSLVWAFTNIEKLGRSALDVFIRADREEVLILIPTIVLLEFLSNSSNYLVVDLTLFDVAQAKELTKLGGDFHDRAIVATAILNGAVLITRDERIKESGYVETVW